MTVGVTALPTEMVLKTIIIPEVVRVKYANTEAFDEASRMRTTTKNWHRMNYKINGPQT